MATATKTWNFAGSVESWAATTGATYTGLYQGGDTYTADGTGCVEMLTVTKNKAQNGYWEYTDTITNIFGIPADATVSQIGGGAGDLVYSKGAVAISVNTCTDGPFQLRNSDGSAVIGTFWTGITFTAPFAWTATNRSNAAIDVAAQSWTGATTIKLRLNDTLSTQNAAGAAVTLRTDRIILTVTYATAATNIVRSVISMF